MRRFAIGSTSRRVRRQAPRGPEVENDDLATRLDDAVLEKVLADVPDEWLEPVPGYDTPGVELHADEHVVRDPPFEWELTAVCAFAAAFDYSSYLPP